MGPLICAWSLGSTILAPSVRGERGGVIWAKENSHPSHTPNCPKPTTSVVSFLSSASSGWVPLLVCVPWAWGLRGAVGLLFAGGMAGPWMCRPWCSHTYTRGPSPHKSEPQIRRKGAWSSRSQSFWYLACCGKSVFVKVETTWFI